MPQWRSYLKKLIGAEISRHSQYFAATLQILPLPHDDGELLHNIVCKSKIPVSKIQDIPAAGENSRRLLLLNGNFNHHFDVQKLLCDLKEKMGRGDRATAVVYNSYYRWVYSMANSIGLRTGDLPTTFFTQGALLNLATIAGFQVTRSRPLGYFPFCFLGLGNLLNHLLQAVPFVRWLGFAEVIILRPVIPAAEELSLTVVVPARNERGNIESVINRMPKLSAKGTQLIFVEGHSHDGTWEEIQRVSQKYGTEWDILCLQQEGKGKADAVRLGLAHAQGDLVTILDADLTMPPELLSRFYDAYHQGLGDFVNGSRLLYPMEGAAMRFLNWLGNVFFAKSLSFVLECQVSDSLCGTKLLARKDYERFRQWRQNFGEFDPFGDYELLFPAAILGLGLIEIPVRYRARTYGSTNIHRFRDGWSLLKMTGIALARVRVGR